ncbi:MAG: hypothetical protein JSV84_00305, partial [Gemmatimonadota bacterium]
RRLTDGSVNDDGWCVADDRICGGGVSGGGGGDRGDVNGDGTFNILDVLLAVRHILGIEHLEDDGLCLADCNDDGRIDVYDVMGIVDVILGTGECAPGTRHAKLGPEALEFHGYDPMY